jgi:hypothetical protein
MNRLLEAALVQLQAQPLPGISAAYLQGFLIRYRPQLRTLLALTAWKQDHDRLRALVLEAERRGWRDVPFNQQVAALIQRHAYQEELAMLALVPDHQSPLHSHILEEHRQLEPGLNAILSGQRVFSRREVADLEHHFDEEEGAFLVHFPPPFWEYRPLFPPTLEKFSVALDRVNLNLLRF